MNILFYYLLAINILTGLIFVWDKQRARYNERRIPEKILWLLAIIGGALGGITAMEVARHKRRKPEFVLVMALILLAQIVLIYFLIKINPAIRPTL